MIFNSLTLGEAVLLELTLFQSVTIRYTILYYRTTYKYRYNTSHLIFKTLSQPFPHIFGIECRTFYGQHMSLKTRSYFSTTKVIKNQKKHTIISTHRPELMASSTDAST